MHDTIFATFLYIAVFCFVCCLRHNPSFAATQPSQLAAQPQHQTEPVTDPWFESIKPQHSTITIADMIDEDSAAVTMFQASAFDSKPNKEAIAEGEVRLSNTPETQVFSHIVPPTPLDGIDDIDLKKLPLRVCRKIASRLTALNESLAINQKVNQKDKPVSQLRVEIKNRLAKDPTVVAPLIVELASLVPRSPARTGRASRETSS
jgi:hypothetical protein